LVPDSAIVTADNSADMQVQGTDEEETAALTFAALNFPPGHAAERTVGDAL